MSQELLLNSEVKDGLNRDLADYQDSYGDEIIDMLRMDKTQDK